MFMVIPEWAVKFTYEDTAIGWRVSDTDLEAVTRTLRHNGVDRYEVLAYSVQTIEADQSERTDGDG